MAYDTHFAERIRQIFNLRHVTFEEKNMMGELILVSRFLILKEKATSS